MLACRPGFANAAHEARLSKRCLPMAFLVLQILACNFHAVGAAPTIHPSEFESRNRVPVRRSNDPLDVSEVLGTTKGMGNTGSTKSSPQTDGFEEKIDHAPDGEDAWFEDESVYLSAAIATTGCICCILCVRCRSSKVDHDAAEEFTSRNAVRLMENGEEPASTAQLPTRPPPPLPGYLPSWLSAASGRRRRHEVGATEEELVCPAQSPGSRRAFAERYHRRASHRAEYPPLGYVLQASTPDSSIPNSATPQLLPSTPIHAFSPGTPGTRERFLGEGDSPSLRRQRRPQLPSPAGCPAQIAEIARRRASRDYDNVARALDNVARAALDNVARAGAGHEHPGSWRTIATYFEEDPEPFSAGAEEAEGGQSQGGIIPGQVLGNGRQPPVLHVRTLAHSPSRRRLRAVAWAAADVDVAPGSEEISLHVQSLHEEELETDRGSGPNRRSEEGPSRVGSNVRVGSHVRASGSSRGAGQPVVRQLFEAGRGGNEV